MNEDPLHTACGICPQQSHVSKNRTHISQVMKPTQIYMQKNNPRLSGPHSCVCVFLCVCPPVWRLAGCMNRLLEAQNQSQTGVFPRAIRRHTHSQNRIRVDSCWCALCFMCALQREICKRDRHRKPPVRDLQLA